MFATNDSRYYPATELNAYVPDPNGPECVSKLLMVEHLFNQHRALWPNCFFPGHFWGTAWVVNPARTHILLARSQENTGWAPLGEHANGDGVLKRVAMQAAQRFLGPNATVTDLHNGRLVDLEILFVPETKLADRVEPTHLHYAMRYAFEVSDKAHLLTATGHELKWFALEEAAVVLAPQAGWLRLLEKTKQL